MELKLAFIGFGNVARGFARILKDHQLQLATKYGLRWRTTGIATANHGCIVSTDGIDLLDAVACVERGENLSELPRSLSVSDPLSAVDSCNADILFETTPLNIADGEPATTHIRKALARGIHVITANKGPIAFAYSELKSLAETRGLSFRFEGTVMDGAPVFNLFEYCLPGVRVLGFSGVLNSTTNHLLSAAARGVAFADALAEAQRLGIAEADPRNDLEGHDAAAKATILANVLMDADLVPEDVTLEPIDERAAQAARAAAGNGDRVRPIIEIARRGTGVVASFGPRRLGPLDPLYAVDDFSMGLVYDTDLAGRVAVQLHDPHVDQVAYAILTDLLEISATMPRP